MYSISVRGGLVLAFGKQLSGLEEPFKSLLYRKQVDTQQGQELDRQQAPHWSDQGKKSYKTCRCKTLHSHLFLPDCPWKLHGNTTKALIL